jgi:endonuclease/exonuclease/phosphatase family metal-dependent hydrolase
MKRTLIAFGLLAALTAAALVACSPQQTSLPPRMGDALRVATYNVHYINLNETTGAWSVGDWDRRKGPMDAAFKTIDADVIGFQEMESFARGDDGSTNLTLDYLLAQNPGYAAAAVGDFREFPSTQPILYRRDRLSLTDQGWFFFSDTPDVIYSRTFNGSYPAFASWARLSDRVTGRQVTVVNVHFEYSSRSNRRRSAELVASRIGPWIAAGEPVILIGDLNARNGSATQDILAAAGVSFLPVQGSTYHFNRGINLFGAIDHIGLAGALAPVGAPVVLRRKFDGEWPTDHYPVIADLRVD